MVLDEVGGVPILASWWPLSATAMVHRRDIDGRGVVFGNQGDLYMKRDDLGGIATRVASGASRRVRRSSDF
jgi:hypothetical protein